MNGRRQTTMTGHAGNRAVPHPAATKHDAGLAPIALLVLRLVVACGLGYSLIALFPVIEAVAIRATLVTTVPALGVAFHGAIAAGDVISTAGTSIRIVSECTPLTPLVLLCGAMWAYPTTWGGKILGTIVAALALWAYNTLRIALLVGVLAHAPGLFDLVHVYLWQSLTIVVVTGLFAGWVCSLGARGPA